MAEPRMTPWQSTQRPTETRIQERIRAEGLRGYSWSNGPFDEYSPHVHPYDKVLYVLRGSITWVLPETGQEIVTNKGDRLDLPRGTVHGARVGKDGVACFEAQV